MYKCIVIWCNLLYHLSQFYVNSWYILVFRIPYLQYGFLRSKTRVNVAYDILHRVKKKRPFFHSTTIACKSHPNDSQTYVYLYIGNVSYLSFETREIEGERWEGMEVKSFVFYRYYRSTMYFMLSRWIECVHLSFKGEKIKENFET